jgi:Uma2 family endonuclease
VILDEPELHLGPDILVPDLAGWRRERMPEIPDVAAFELPPDWICEVLSSSTAGIDRADKLPIYARQGVSHAWLLDPLAQTLEVLERQGQQWLLLSTHRDQVMICAAPFEALEWDLGTLWSR